MQSKKTNYVDVIIPFFTPPFIGGTETVIRSWEKHLIGDIREVKARFINVFQYKQDDFLENYRGSKISYGKLFSSQNLVKKMGLIYLIYHLSVTKADTIIVLSPKYIKLAFYIRKILKKKYKIISWMHFSLSRMFVNEREAFLLADYHFAISSGIKKQLQDFGVKSDKISVVYNPIKKVKKVVKVSARPRFLYVGRLEVKNQKNLNEMLKAIAEFKKSYNDVLLEIWGDGIEREKLERIVRKLKIEDNVVFKGRVSNPWEKISEGTALLLTSTFEGLPMSILEALSSGLPVISSDIETGPRDEINNENGKLYKLGDIHQLVNKMEFVYTNPQKYPRKGVKESITKFYEENYYYNIVNILKRVGS
ncbi:glycosyltransferase [Pediococcus pentosaceus]|uniref:glycosyltransferase n=1 Tax=Pediococcus pentosaceus TaxID=1255 RepID=UPI001C1E9D40|nr:glycosyltransferase [Pediococcus pentosaceus]MBU7003677.1 glycosyltransferase [Pediococcus pentosaceus]MCG9225689.1 glycosyltransferase [Pediococcus pentosaceus]MDA8035694.1 glycosyltransferase [Pediococcus pentosaceus]